MIQRIDFRGRILSTRELREALPRASFDVEAAIATVQPIVSDVRHRGATALREYAEKFDGVRPENLRVSKGIIAQALESLDPAVRSGLEESIRRVRLVHAAQRPHDFATWVSPGGEIRQRWIPVGRVGLYVPGGLAVYPSSVVMNVVAAQEAGVASLAVASPPQKEYGGRPHPTILAACALLGIDEVYAVGGAQAIAMFAYGAVGSEPQDGSTLCEPVDVITGPGNVWVAAAKRVVLGTVGIDAEAGPTEIAILADASATPHHVAVDLISQAEHDPLAASVLVTDSPELADAVEEIITERSSATKHATRVHQALGGQQSGIVLVDDMDQGLDVVNAYGAEHLEIHTVNASETAERVRNAGAIFVGSYSPVPLGDYISGSNHVLPTGGVASYASGLGVHSFLRAVQVIEYTKEGLREVSDHVVALSRAEDLPAHGEAVQARFR